MRAVFAVLACCVLSACGAARQTVLEETDAPAISLADALANCRNLFPDQIAQAVLRADCFVAATETAVRPTLPFPELLDQENMLRKALADQVQSGRASLLERNAQIVKGHAALVREEAGRLKAMPPEGRPKTSAIAVEWRASNPEGCAGLGGNTAVCF